MGDYLAHLPATIRFKKVSIFNCLIEDTISDGKEFCMSKISFKSQSNSAILPISKKLSEVKDE